MSNTNYLMTHLGLFGLAGKERTRLDGQRGVYVEATASGVYPYAEQLSVNFELRRFARDVTGREPESEPALMLSGIVSAEASALLLQMPNEYWFWTVLEASLVAMGGKSEQQLDVAQVLAGIQSLRQGDKQRRSHLEYTHARYETEQGLMAVVADSTLRGQLLVVYEDGFPIRVFDNPVFDDQQFTL